jgi:hypothetical protein
MKITVEATGTIDTIKGPIMARIWEGHTESGIPVKAWIAVVQPQTHDEAALAEFDRQLKEIKASRELVSFDLRMVL